ncbi:MAG TPA: hypothetical protein VI362_05095 [Ignavibacteriaceae bacterium]|nr:hypothetical protein [Ignavibacteriaceae bacterium]
MSLKNHLRKYLFGITLPQEFICIDIENFASPLKIFLKSHNSQSELIEDDEQLFLGYKPLVIGIIAVHNSTRYKYLSESSIIKLNFKNENHNSVAELELRKFEKVENESATLFLYEGLQGDYSFQSKFHFIMNNLKYRLTPNKKQNVYLHGNLYQQVVIAYSVPRVISLISISDGRFCNLFPTDLNGNFGKENYIISLRIGGKASEQVERIKKVLLAKMPVDSCSNVYSLSKNHMQELTDENNFKFKKERSVNFNFPVPDNVVSYSELKLTNSVEIGIHKLYFFKIVHTESINQSKSILAHIHRTYAEWRKRNSIHTDFVIR